MLAILVWIIHVLEYFSFGYCIKNTWSKSFSLAILWTGDYLCFFTFKIFSWPKIRHFIHQISIFGFTKQNQISLYDSIPVALQIELFIWNSYFLFSTTCQQLNECSSFYPTLTFSLFNSSCLCKWFIWTYTCPIMFYD